MAASISPAINAASANGERGMTIYCISRPCFLNRPRSRATHTTVMLSLVMLDAKLVRVCAVAGTDATTQHATAKKVRKTRWQLDRLPRIMIGRLTRFFFADRLDRQKTMLGNIEVVAIDI